MKFIQAIVRAYKWTRDYEFWNIVYSNAVEYLVNEALAVFGQQPFPESILKREGRYEKTRLGRESADLRRTTRSLDLSVRDAMYHNPKLARQFAIDTLRVRAYPSSSNVYDTLDMMESYAKWLERNQAH